MNKPVGEAPKGAARAASSSLPRTPDPALKAFKRRLDEYLAEAIKLADAISKRTQNGRADP
ncbi:MAG TPA: hypothetical protein VEC58_07635 [Roseiarcus sp.]|nr:hypothetical protein [Roseiarcus sp.]